MLRLHVGCPHCDTSFNDPSHLIDDFPSILLKMEVDGRKGFIRLSTLYGSYNLESEFPIPQGSLVNLYCRSCGKSLESTRKCDLCGAPMAKMKLASGGYIQVCMRKGCKKHVLEFEDIDGDLQPFVDIQLMD
ncbi:MAG: hypothetical protein GXP49_12815 [Deltaproteobacteria bacterium]|nr:hypothetical protein [Deltaproteobacteria bacterium]